MLSLSDCTQSTCPNPTPWITIFIIIVVVVVILGLAIGVRKRRNKPLAIPATRAAGSSSPGLWRPVRGILGRCGFRAGPDPGSGVSVNS
jgi:hypothetical protein